LQRVLSVGGGEGHGEWGNRELGIRALDN
jgi:hypothetical protein